MRKSAVGLIKYTKVYPVRLVIELIIISGGAWQVPLILHGLFDINVIIFMILFVSIFRLTTVDLGFNQIKVPSHIRHFFFVIVNKFIF